MSVCYTNKNKILGKESSRTGASLWDIGSPFKNIPRKPSSDHAIDVEVLVHWPKRAWQAKGTTKILFEKVQNLVKKYAMQNFNYLVRQYTFSSLI